MASDSSAASSLPPAAADAAAAAVRAAIEKSQKPGSSATETENKGEDGKDEPKQTVEPGLANKDVTVFSDAANFNVKHPLYSPWTMWFDSASKQVSSETRQKSRARTQNADPGRLTALQDKAKSWDDALVKVIAFESVEEFWR